MSVINDAIKKAAREYELKNESLRAKARGFSEQNTEQPRMYKKAPDEVVDEHEAMASTLQSSEIKWALAAVISLIIVGSLLGSMALYRHLSRTKTGYKNTPLEQKLDARSQPYASDTEKRVQKKAISPSLRFSDMELNGIVYGPTDKWAVINDRVVREGDAVSGGRLSYIAKDFVKIEKSDGTEAVLDLK